jgi:hypothetical protein
LELPTCFRHSARSEGAAGSEKHLFVGAAILQLREHITDMRVIVRAQDDDNLALKLAPPAAQQEKACLPVLELYVGIRVPTATASDPRRKSASRDAAELVQGRFGLFVGRFQIFQFDFKCLLFRFFFGMTVFVHCRNIVLGYANDSSDNRSRSVMLLMSLGVFGSSIL